MKTLGWIALLSLVLVSPVSASRSTLHRIEGEVLERHGIEYVVIEGEAVPLHGSGGEPPGSLIVVVDPDPRAAPGPGTSYVGFGVYAGHIRGIASNDVALPLYRATDLFEVTRAHPGRPNVPGGR